MRRVIYGVTYDDKGDGVNQRLREECPPRESRYSGGCPARSYLTAEK